MKNKKNTMGSKAASVTKNKSGKKLPEYDERSIMMHWSNTGGLLRNKTKKTGKTNSSVVAKGTSKKKLPEYDERSIMMHWSNTGIAN